MCKVLSSMRVRAECRNVDEPEVTFRRLLLDRCQEEFEKNSGVELNWEARLKEIQQTTDPVSSLNVLGSGLILLHLLSTYHYFLRFLRFL
jgi:hypothetical protein